MTVTPHIVIVTPHIVTVTPHEATTRLQRTTIDINNFIYMRDKRMSLHALYTYNVNAHLFLLNIQKYRNNWVTLLCSRIYMYKSHNNANHNIVFPAYFNLFAAKTCTALSSVDIAKLSFLIRADTCVFFIIIKLQLQFLLNLRLL